jgi:hypothetical protein
MKRAQVEEEGAHVQRYRGELILGLVFLLVGWIRAARHRHE